MSVARIAIITSLMIHDFTRRLRVDPFDLDFDRAACTSPFRRLGTSEAVAAQSPDLKPSFTLDASCSLVMQTNPSLVLFDRLKRFAIHHRNDATLFKYFVDRQPAALRPSCVHLHGPRPVIVDGFERQRLGETPALMLRVQ